MSEAPVSNYRPPEQPTKRMGGTKKSGGLLRWVGIAGGLAAIAVVLVLVVGSGEDSVDDMLADARTQLASEALIEAEIALKNVIKRDPENLEARSLLGQLYLDTKRPADAVKELSKASALDPSSTELLFQLSEAAVGARNLKAGRDAVRKLHMRGASGAQLDLLEAELALGDGDFEAALELASKIESDTEFGARAALLQGRIALAQRESGVAREKINLALELDAGLLEGQVLKAMMALDAGDLAAAADAVEAAKKVEPDDSRVLLLDLELALYADDLERGEAVYKTLADRGIGGISMARARALLDFGAGNLTAAETGLLELEANDVRDPLLLWANARLALQQQDAERAEQNLKILASVRPNSLRVVRLLLSTLISQGKVEEAAPILKAVREAGVDKAWVALQTSEVLARQGDAEGAMTWLAKAAELAPENEQIAMRLSMGEIMVGDAERGFDQLEALAESTESTDTVRFALVSAYLTDGRRDEALALARSLVDAEPTNVKRQTVLGNTLLNLGMREEARTTYERVLALDPDVPGPLTNLARLDLAAGDVSSAKARLNKILQANPGAALPSLILAEVLAEREGNVREAAEILDLALAKQPQAPQLQILRAYLRVEQGNPARALEDMSALLAVTPDVVDAQQVAAQAEIALGEFEAARARMDAMAERAPLTAKQLMVKAKAVSGLGDKAATQKLVGAAFERAREQGDIGTQIGCIRTMVRMREIDRASTWLDAVAADNAAFASGPLKAEISGDIARRRGDSAAAAIAYRTAVEAAPTPARLQKWAMAETAQGGFDAVDAKLMQMSDADATNVDLLRVHAQLALPRDEARSIDRYEALLALVPDDIEANNNLAYLYSKRRATGDIQKALKLSQYAVDKYPRSPAPKDTLGWILFETGKLEQALELLTQAHELAPNDPSIAFHLATTQASLGQSDVAKTLLARTLAEHASFPERKEAESLAARL